MRHLPTVVVAIALITSGCSIETGDGGERLRTAEPTTTTTEATTAAAAIGIVEIGGETYEITADCYTPSAGNVIAVGADTTDTGGRIEVYVATFNGQQYVGVTVFDGESTLRYEPVVDQPLEVILFDNVVRVDDISLVTGLDLKTGDGTDAGVGSVVIECRSSIAALPPGFVAR
ncbi:MAG: hypothetical protein CL433_08135 [Acidimicrobiaceae bacterium]|jgi:hypothetical protein|nr:hypothetical protein [Acidimicrobiaceae bacterium]HAB56803.1 hypothetical protein [Acidimicrobiaceae bacterium]